MLVLKNKLFTLYIKILSTLLKLIPVKKGRICILNGSGYSGSNGLAMYKYLKEEQDYEDVWLIENFPSSHLPFKVWFKIASAEVILGTHDPYKVSKKQAYIQLWHGVPLKRMGFLAKNIEKSSIEVSHKHWGKTVNYITSSSDTYDTLMSACEGITNDKFIHLGFPRNDFFNIDEAKKTRRRQELERLFEPIIIENKPRILFYLPTFRMEDNNELLSEMLKAGNIFGLSDFDQDDFEAVLERENIIIVAKLHPVEEKKVNTEALNKLKHMKIIDGDWLRGNEHDLYEYLAVTDALITDYSSVYFDYLLMNKPLLFLVNDLQNYNTNRGFLLNPYRTFAPGLVAEDWHTFERALIQVFRVNLQDERNRVKEIIYQDEYLESSASEQIWEQLIQKLI
ncbi:CDP-glycerol--glycerophosphate glycerophosphotransferase [Lactobacillus curvatus] [Latilactobacillus sakei]|nr:CDP-glycerol--glycerophosphate glycerophosphotransferase [Lactobacillus curvatus] [Latilactobacillus sakei]